MEKKIDMVKSPPHYKKHSVTLQPIDILEHLSFNLGNAFKYIIRSKDKNNELEDLKKAVWYFDRYYQNPLEKIDEAQQMLLYIYFTHSNPIFKFRSHLKSPECDAYNYALERIEQLEEENGRRNPN